jgi:murein L,D-transpeptidase YcbB/YkuD
MKKIIIRKRTSAVWLATLCILLCRPIVLPAVDNPDFASTLIEQLEYKPARHLGVQGHGMDADRVDEILSEAYHSSGLKPFWVQPDGPGERAKIIFDTLKASKLHGLNPNMYYVDKIEKYWKRRDAVGLVRLDILLTLGLRGYVCDMREGRIEPRKVDPKLFSTARDVEFDFDALREQALSATDMTAFLNHQAPPFLQYQSLVKALKAYREIEKAGGWKSIPSGKVLKPGMEDMRVNLIRIRLALTGDLMDVESEGSLYDNEVVTAVKNFQSRHGLEVDGITGKNTLSVMNVPVEDRIRQIIINMERYRWVKRQTEDRMILVNIAGFRAAGIKPKEGKIEIVMPVIVGREYHKTPVFSNAIEYIEFNPYWNVPPGIARNEMLRKLYPGADERENLPCRKEL